MESFESNQRSKFFAYYEVHKDSLDAVDDTWLLNHMDSTTVFSYYGVEINYDKAKVLLDKTNGKHIAPYYRPKLAKIKKTLPILYISIPVIAGDRKKAIHYLSMATNKLWNYHPSLIATLNADYGNQLNNYLL